jgi:hypothetical protein
MLQAADLPLAKTPGTDDLHVIASAGLSLSRGLGEEPASVAARIGLEGSGWRVAATYDTSNKLASGKGWSAHVACDRRLVGLARAGFTVGARNGGGWTKHPLTANLGLGRGEWRVMGRYDLTTVNTVHSIRGSYRLYSGRLVLEPVVTGYMYRQSGRWSRGSLVQIWIGARCL